MRFGVYTGSLACTSISPTCACLSISPNPQPYPGRQARFPVAGCRQCADQGPGRPARHAPVVPRQPGRGDHPGRRAAVAPCAVDHAPGGLPQKRVHPIRRRFGRAYPYLRQHHGGHRILPEVLAGFLSQRPGVTVDLQERLSRDIVRGVLDGTSDMGIIAGPWKPPACKYCISAPMNWC